MTPYRDRLNAGYYTATTQPAAQPDTNAEVDATGAAETRAQELGIDITTIKGTGKDGRVTVADVEAAAAD